jgi:hypothetical protein
LKQMGGQGRAIGPDQEHRVAAPVKSPDQGLIHTPAQIPLNLGEIFPFPTQPLGHGGLVPSGKMDFDGNRQAPLQHPDMCQCFFGKAPGDPAGRFGTQGRNEPGFDETGFRVAGED